MALAEVRTVILDGALDLSPQDLTAISAAVGVSSAGAVNTILSASRVRDATEKWATGPLPEKIAYHVGRSKKPVYGARVNASIAGSVGSITKSDSGSPTIVASGVPLDAYDVILRFPQESEVGSGSGSGSFQYSVDGGDSFTAEIALPAGANDTPAIVTGTVDLTQGALYGAGGTLNGLTLIAEINNGGSVTCTFSAPANKAQVVSQLNAAFGGTHFSAPGNFLVLNSTTTGSSGEVDITGGTARGMLGLTVGVTNGINATAAVVTGTGDLSVGGLYGVGGTLDGLTFIAEINNGGSVTCTFASPADKAALLSQLNTAFGGSHFTAPGNFLIINSTTTGTSGEVDITGGTARAILGFSIATTNGVNATAAVVTGTRDLSVGSFYGSGGSLDGLTFIAEINNGGSATATLSAPASKAALVSQLNTAFGGSHFSAPGLYLVISSTTTGAASEVDVTGGTGRTALGFSIATTNGAAGTGTYDLGTTGVTIGFPQGTYDEGISYTFPTTAPNFSLADLTAALDVFMADHQKKWFLLHVVGAATSAANARAMADVLATYAADAESAHRFTFFVMETPADATKEDLKAAFASFESTRVAVSFGYEELTSEATKDGGVKRVFSRPTAWADVMRWAEIAISEKAAYVGRGKLEGVVSVDQDTLDAAEEMSDARFLAHREIIGKSGYFLAEDCLMAPVGSDFAIVPYRRIMDVACTDARARLVNYMQGKILVDPTTGFIQESVAQAIESDVGSVLKEAVVNDGHASSARIVVTRDNDILRTSQFLVETRVVPPGYAKEIIHTIGFLNPTVSTT